MSSSTWPGCSTPGEGVGTCLPSAAPRDPRGISLCEGLRFPGGGGGGSWGRRGVPRALKLPGLKWHWGRLQELFLVGRLDAPGLSAWLPLAPYPGSAVPLPSPSVDDCWVRVRGCEGTRCGCPHLQLTLQTLAVSLVLRLLELERGDTAGGQAEPAMPPRSHPSPPAPLCPQHGLLATATAATGLKQELTSTSLYCFLNKLPLPWTNIVLQSLAYLVLVQSLHATLTAMEPNRRKIKTTQKLR